MLNPRCVLIISMVISIILYSGCTTKKYYENKYLGKWLSTASLHKIYDSGSHRDQKGAMYYKYDYVVDKSGGTITLKGIIEYNKPIEDSVYRTETFLLKFKNYVLICFFTDNDGFIVAVETADLPLGKSITEPVPFEVVLPFKPKYKYVLTGFSYYADEGY